MRQGTPRQNICACVNFVQFRFLHAFVEVGLVFRIAVLKLVVLNQQPRMREKRTKTTEKVCRQLLVAITGPENVRWTSYEMLRSGHHYITD